MSSHIHNIREKKTSVYHTVNGDPAHCFTHRKPQKW